MILDGEYKVYIVTLPGDVRGAVRIDEDGFASIYINDALCPKARRATFMHEIRHVLRNDHYNTKSIREVERK